MNRIDLISTSMYILSLLLYYYEFTIVINNDRWNVVSAY